MENCHPDSKIGVADCYILFTYHMYFLIRSSFLRNVGHNPQIIINLQIRCMNPKLLSFSVMILPLFVVHSSLIVNGTGDFVVGFPKFLAN